MASKTVTKAKQNPLIAGLVTLASIAIAAGAIWKGVGLADQLHTTEAELLIYDLKAHTFATQQFSSLESAIGRIEITSKCRWLSSEIRALKNVIYERTRDGADQDYLNELSNDLGDLEADYAALKCAALMA